MKNNVESAKHEIGEAAATAVKSIAVAAEAAAKVISTSASEASRVVVNNATQTAKSLTVRSSDDHDRIVVLDTKLDAISDQIKELKDNNAKRIDDLEKNKLNTRDSYPVLYKESIDKCIADHEDRIRKNTVKLTIIMTVGSAIIFAITIIEFIIQKWY